MPLTHDLPHFRRKEFRHPELIDEIAANFLEAVRVQYGNPIVVTSDARTEAENVAAGGSALSWHVQGRAFDLRWPATDALAFQLINAILFVHATWLQHHTDHSLELELVYSERDKHVHFAVKNNRSPDRLIVAAD